jgi:hypothetical protein
MTLAPLLARSLAASRPIPALASVPTFLLALAGEEDPGLPASQISNWLLSLPFSLLLQARMTLAPLLARSLADFRPIPALAPVPTFLLAPAGKDDPGPLLARSLADSRPIPALAPVPTFLLAPAGEEDPGPPAGQVSS